MAIVNHEHNSIPTSTPERSTLQQRAHKLYFQWFKFKILQKLYIFRILKLEIASSQASNNEIEVVKKEKLNFKM